MNQPRDTDLACTTCRWRAGHSPDCPRKDEPWPSLPEVCCTAQQTQPSADLGSTYEAFEVGAQVHREHGVPPALEEVMRLYRETSMPADLVHAVTHAVRFATNPLDGDAIGVMIHNHDLLPDDLPLDAQIAKVDEVCRAIAEAAINAVRAYDQSDLCERRRISSSLDGPPLMAWRLRNLVGTLQRNMADSAGRTYAEMVVSGSAAMLVEQSEEIGRLRTALTLFTRCAYPVCTSINPRGHGWKPEGSLDYALGEARKALGDKP